ncbi:MAG: ATP-dependent Clp protease proteolytic subunit [Planctomycetes bacterium]|nr:ATP-dependent Clp protease proteolytic subunit [Planctomycetota bacterium]
MFASFPRLAVGLLLIGLALAVTPTVNVAVAAPDSSDADSISAAGVRGAIIPIMGEITDVTTRSIKRRVEAFRADGVGLIVFELNTPGGMVSSAIDICDYIKNLTDVTTVAWVHTQAYSAGSMIAVACDEIVMASASTLGDCGVIMGLPWGGAEAVPEELRAKAESPVLEQFRDSARRNGYDAALCESLVIKERELWWIEHVITGEREFVDRQEKDQRLALTSTGAQEADDESDDEAADESPPETGESLQWRLVETYIDPVSGREVEIDQPVITDTELLTMSQSRAFALGFSSGIVSTVDELRERYGLTGPLTPAGMNWAEVLVGWLTSMPVRGFLLLIVFLGAYVEFNTPGVGVPGLVALIALAVFVVAPFLTGLANTWEIVLIVVGFLLIALEIFVIPGFGVAGISGLLLVVGGLLATFMPEEPGRVFPLYWPHLEAGLDGLKRGVITLAASMAGALVSGIFIGRNIHRIPFLRTIVPQNPMPSQVAVDDPYHGLARVGDVGLVEAPLHPAGKARFGSMMVDVVTEGDLVDTGGRVEVIERRGNRVVVRKIGRGGTA